MQDNGLDLSSLDVKTGSDQGFKLYLLHPGTGEPLSLWIDILGADSDAYQDKKREIVKTWEERLKRDQRAKLSDDEAEEQGRDLLVAATRGWCAEMKLDGELLPFSVENARQLYANKRFPWIPEQVYRGIHKRANFLPGNGTSS